MAMELEEARALYAQGKRDLKSDEADARESQRRLQARRKFMESLIELFPEIAASEIDPEFVVRGDNAIVANRTLERGSAFIRARLADGGSDGEPRGKQAALEVLRSSPGEWFSVRAMTEELINRGWMSATSNDPESAARQSLYRLAEGNDRVERKSVDGVLSFRYRHPRSGPVPPRRQNGEIEVTR